MNAMVLRRLPSSILGGLEDWRMRGQPKVFQPDEVVRRHHRGAGDPP
jgi:hypothetical protein